MTITRPNGSHRRASSTRRSSPGISAVVAALLLLVVTTALVSSRAAAQSVPTSACPEMTDSIRRIYRAYFLREPSPTEAFDWTTKYMNGEVNLPGIASTLVRSREFQQQWGTRTSAEFVELIHLNTEGSSPSNEDLRHWTRALNTGYTRGQMTIALTESKQFVTTTNTARPLAGYLRWYPSGSHWYCGSGSRDFLSVKPLTGDVLFADRLVRNEGLASATFDIATMENGQRNAVIASGSIPPQATDYLWFGAFSGDGYYGSSLTVEAPETTRWIVVFYPTSIGKTRLGWQILP